MKLVLKNNKIIATHEDYQDIDSLYEDCYIITRDSGEIMDDFEITQEIINESNNSMILAQIKDIQTNKLPRAFFEPSEKEEGLTWLEYYTNEINTLRSKIIKEI